MFFVIVHDVCIQASALTCVYINNVIIVRGVDEDISLISAGFCHRTIRFHVVAVRGLECWHNAIQNNNDPVEVCLSCARDNLPHLSLPLSSSRNQI